MSCAFLTTLLLFQFRCVCRFLTSFFFLTAAPAVFAPPHLSPQHFCSLKPGQGNSFLMQLWTTTYQRAEVARMSALEVGTIVRGDLDAMIYIYFFKRADENLEMSRWSLERRGIRMFGIELHKTDNIQGLLFWHVVVSEQQRGMCLPPQQIRPNAGRRYVCWPVSAANLQDVTLTRKHVRRKSKTHIQALAHCRRSEALRFHLPLICEKKKGRSLPQTRQQNRNPKRFSSNKQMTRLRDKDLDILFHFCVRISGFCRITSYRWRVALTRGWEAVRAEELQVERGRDGGRGMIRKGRGCEEDGVMKSLWANLSKDDIRLCGRSGCEYTGCDYRPAVCSGQSSCYLLYLHIKAANT